MTIRICWQLPLLNFKRLDMLCPESNIRVKSYDHSNFSRASVLQFRASRYIISRNQTSVWKVWTIWISQKLPLFNFERLDILSAWIGHPSEMLWPFEFLEGFRCSISSVSIYYFAESDIRVKSYDHSNLSRASVVQFRAIDILFPRTGHPCEIL